MTDGNRVLGLVLDAAKTVFHGYPCREGTLLQYRRTPVAHARMGETVKIVGRLRASAPAFTAPLSGATCVWYRTVAQTWDGFLYSPRRITEHRFQDVFVDDETGSALIRMQTAEVSLEEMRAGWCYEPPAPWDDLNNAATENVQRFLIAHGYQLNYFPRSILERMLSEAPTKRGARYKEFVLREGDRVAVLGEAVRQPDPAAHADGLRRPVLQLVLGEETAAPIVSNEPGVWT